MREDLVAYRVLRSLYDGGPSDESHSLSHWRGPHGCAASHGRSRVEGHKSRSRIYVLAMSDGTAQRSFVSRI